MTPEEPRWLRRAWLKLGLKEGAGALDNPDVVALFKAVGHPEIKHDSTPWCAAFVGAVLEAEGIPSTRSLAARSYENWGRKLLGPRYGCVGVKRRPGPSWGGHVGFVVAANAFTIWLVGGNQGDAVSVAGFPREQFTAFRWPSSAPTDFLPMPANYRAPMNVRQD